MGCVTDELDLEVASLTCLLLAIYERFYGLNMVVFTFSKVQVWIAFRSAYWVFEGSDVYILYFYQFFISS